ncbi:chemotaxis protein CheA [Desulfobacterales bacterium HSG16]|nr:chemotaxis protein CheA [Desulfobacterales bacterium HSG16]
MTDMLDTQSFFEEFVAEAKEHLDTIENDLINIENQKDEPDNELVNKVFRGIHSIKGASGFLGLNKIGELTHVMETLLAMIREKEICPETEFIDALLEGTDLLKIMTDDPGNSDTIDIKEIYNRIHTILSSQLVPNLQKELDTSIRLFGPGGYDTGFKIDALRLKKIPSTMFLYVLKYNLIEFAKNGKQSPLALIRELLETGEIIDGKIDAPSDDLNVNLADIPLIYEALYVTFMDSEMMHEMTGLSENCVIRVTEDRFIEKTELDYSPDILKEKSGIKIDMSANDKPDSTTEKTKNRSDDRPDDRPYKETLSESIRVPAEKLDRLVNIVGELVTLQANIAVEARQFPKNSRLNSISEEFDRLTEELREIALNVRMLPIGATFARFTRLIRDISKKQGKEVEMTTKGEETELDKKVIERLYDPLSHIIRNSMDHGIETPEVRKAFGKPACGKIQMTATHSGGNVLIQIKDDGAGLDIEKIRERAIKAGLITADEKISEKEIIGLMFAPGLSTARKVTDISGRGVGMDVVKREVEALHGSIDIHTEKKVGAAFTLKIPMTLAIIDGLLITVGKEKLIIPLPVVEECIRLEAAEMTDARRLNIIKLRNKTVPYANLMELLMIEGEHVNNELIVIAETRDGRLALGVHRIIGMHKTVIKTLGKAYKDVKGFTGATTLGDGTVALILDVNQISEIAAKL